MKIPLQITYNHLEKDPAIDKLVRAKVEKIEQFCNYMNSCRVTLEKVHENPDSGSPYRVQIDMTVPPSHELVVDRSPDRGVQYTPLDVVVRDAFDAARRQLQELKERQRNEVKRHPDQQMVAVVSELHPDENYGFLKTINTGRELYFNRQSSDQFDRLEVGTGVQYREVPGEGDRPYAISLKIVNKPGERETKSDESNIEAPMGWR
ncbi:HPF/RaiA family ribosome-associated protein [Baaleninema sp.]|uniref:HPF/RaiA family ribosome-associated protein n=1 Tax=Baaleninema sp. TaxID=3101197 RepID=UPI003D000CE4